MPGHIRANRGSGPGDGMLLIVWAGTETETEGGSRINLELLSDTSILLIIVLS